MKKVLFSLAVFIILCGALVDATLAGNTSYGIAVSCTIPAIPGINVPLIEEESVATVPQLTTSVQEQALQEQPIEKEQLLSSEAGVLMLTKTIYSR